MSTKENHSNDVVVSPGNVDKKKYNALIVTAREFESAKEYSDAIRIYERATTLFAHPKVLVKLEKLRKKTAATTAECAKASTVATTTAAASVATKASVATAHLVTTKEAAANGGQPTDSGEVQCGNGWVRFPDGSYGVADDEEDGAFALPGETYNKLYDHQRAGILWMHSLHLQGAGIGGILADDMGLGKTIQVSAFLEGVLATGMARTALLVLPLSVVPNWGRELGKWAPGIPVRVFHDISNKNAEAMLAQTRSTGGIVLTTYGMLVSIRRKEQLHTVEWDYVVLDEGHKIKNPACKVSKSLRELPAKHRLLLTGTPVQNNLGEMWALYDFCMDGVLFGTKLQFQRRYASHIILASDRLATQEERERGAAVAAELRHVIAPYFLRREKQEVLSITPASSRVRKVRSKWDLAKGVDDDGGDEEEEDDGGPPASPSMALLRQPTTSPSLARTTVTTTTTTTTSLTRKNDLIVWIPLTALQKQLYQDFVNSEDVQTLLYNSGSPLVALIVLKKLCDHPRLVARSAQFYAAIDQIAQRQEPVPSDALESGNASIATTMEAAGATCAATDGADLDLDEGSEVAQLAAEVPNKQDLKVTLEFFKRLESKEGPASLGEVIAESVKMIFLVKLMENLHAEGHRVLFFSQSRKMLDVVEAVLLERNYGMVRIDGRVKVGERERLVQAFNNEPETYFCCLLTVQVGGVGLTLTGADRVIIYDPSWNPATDNQAVDRAYRIGQTRDVTVYRLITCGTVEEKIYRRQVFKSALSRAATNQCDPLRYFSKQELRELFILDDTHQSKTQQQLSELHSSRRATDKHLEAHIAYLQTLGIVGLSDHDLLFSEAGVSALAEGDRREREAQRIKLPPSIQRAITLVQKAEGEEGKDERGDNAPTRRVQVSVAETTEDCHTSTAISDYEKLLETIRTSERTEDVLEACLAALRLDDSDTALHLLAYRCGSELFAES